MCPASQTGIQHFSTNEYIGYNYYFDIVLANWCKDKVIFSKPKTSGKFFVRKHFWSI